MSQEFMRLITLWKYSIGIGRDTRGTYYLVIRRPCNIGMLNTFYPLF